MRLSLADISSRDHWRALDNCLQKISVPEHLETVKYSFYWELFLRRVIIGSHMMRLMLGLQDEGLVNSGAYSSLVRLNYRLQRSC